MSESKELAMDVTVERARALHRIVRAMHDGHCPACGCLDDASAFREGYRHKCPNCGFTVSVTEAQAALKEFQPLLQKSLAVFEEWRASRKRPAKPWGQPPDSPVTVG